MKRWKRAAAAILSISMVLSTMDFSAFAQEQAFSVYEQEIMEPMDDLFEIPEEELLPGGSDSLFLSDTDYPEPDDQILEPVEEENDLDGDLLIDESLNEDPNPESSLDPEAQPEVDLEAQPKADPEAQPEADPEAQPEADPEAQPEADPGVQPETDIQVQTEPDIEAVSETASEFGMPAGDDDQPEYTVLTAQVLSEDMVIEGDALFEEEGILDLAGHSLTVNGNLLQNAGTIFLHAGTLTVTGNYMIRRTSGPGGMLVMINRNDRVTVGGDFWGQTAQNEFTISGQRISEVLTAGILEVQGNICIPSGAFFRPAGSHKVLLSGTGLRFVTMDNPWEIFNILEITQDKKQYVLSMLPCWNKLIKDGEEIDKTGFYDFLMAPQYIEDENGIAPGEEITVIDYVGTSLNIEVPETVGPYTVRTIGSEAFAGLGEVKSIELPETIVYFGSYAFADCASLEEFTIPLGVTDFNAQDFQGCSSLRKMVVRSNVRRIMGNLGSIGNITLYVEKDSEGEHYAQRYNLPYEYIAADDYNIGVSVVDEAGDPVTEGYTVSWSEKDSGIMIGTGMTLNRPEVGKTYLCEINLDEELSYLYLPPARLEFTASGADEIKEVVLERIGSFTVNGIVKNRDGEGIPFADVVFRQLFREQYEKTLVTKADETGSFSALISRTATTVTVSAEGYFNGRYTLDENAEDGSTLDVILLKTPLCRITLQLTKQDAAEAGQNPLKTRITSCDGIRITAYNETRGEEMTGLTVQYPYLYYGSSCDIGDVIRLSLRDERGEMTCGDVLVTLDERKCADADCVFMENGRIRVKKITGKEEYSVMVFNAQGNLADSSTVHSSYLGKALPAGDYTCILMDKTSLLRKVERLEKLQEYGLAEDLDYTAVPVTVQQGVISVVSSITIPDLDESKLYYTKPDNTYIMTSDDMAITGQYAAVMVRYELEEEIASSNEKVLLELPDGTALVPGSMTVNGNAALYTQDGRFVTVPVNASKSILRFKVVPADEGEKSFYASLSFSYGQDLVEQPIGAAVLEVSAATLLVPAKTNKKAVTASGKTVPDCEITVYDNGEEVGTTVSSKSGSWDLQFSLVDPQQYSVHEIYAHVINPGLPLDIQTKPSVLIYNEHGTEVVRVTMINTAHSAADRKPHEYVTGLDFQVPPHKTPCYRYWPTYPTFSFLVVIHCEDPSLLQDVYVVTTSAAGDVVYVRCNYDGRKGVWTGTHDYLSFADVPTKISVRYREDGIEYEQEYSEDAIADEVADAPEIEDLLVTELEDKMDAGETVVDEDTITSDIMIDGEVAAVYQVKILDIADFNLEEWEAVNCQTFEYEDGSYGYQSAELTDDSYVRYYAHPQEEIFIREEITLVIPSGSKAVSRSSMLTPSFFEKMTKMWPFFHTPAHLLTELDEFIKPYKEYKQAKANEDILWEKYEELKNEIHYCSCTGTYLFYGLLDDLWQGIDDYHYTSYQWIIAGMTVDAVLLATRLKMAETISKSTHVTETIKKFYRYLQKVNGKSGKGRLKNWVKFGIKVISSLTGDAASHGAKYGIEKLCGLLDLLDFSGLMIQKGFNSLKDQAEDLKEWFETDGCPCYGVMDFCPCEYERNTDGRRVKPIEDPSGYVYEAVPSNRVSGVKAQLYTYDYAVDENGQQADVKSEFLWDAENYDQVNPQYTDEDGYFGWDVPAGSFVVKFSKEGYEDADSRQDPAADENGYLPVPPIQTEVNTAIVSKNAPQVGDVRAYTDQIRIEFSQYMQIDSVNSETILVSSNGENLNGTIAPLNAELNYEQTQEFASVFAFVSAEPMFGSVSVSVKDVKNYNGTALAAEYSQSCDVTVRPEDLVFSGGEAVLHHGDTQMQIQVQPAQAGAARKIRVVSYSPSIVTVENETVVTDTEGKAIVTLHGILPGTGIIGISLDGTDLYLEKKILVGDTAEHVTLLEESAYPVSLGTETFEYDGTEKKPAVAISGLIEGTDYEVSYSNNTDAGTATVTVTGLGTYFGVIKKNFEIALGRNSITASDISIDASGKAQSVPLGAKAISGQITYSVEDDKLQVDGRGILLIPEKYIGKTVVTMTAGSSNYMTVTKSICITVNPLENRISAGDRRLTCSARNQTFPLSVRQSGSGKISYSSNQGSVQVNASGTVTVQKNFIGKAVITVHAAASGIYKAAEKTVTVTVNPAKPKLKSAKNTKGYKIVVKWKKDAACTGYELQYSTSKKFASGAKTIRIKKNKTVSWTIKKLKNKKTYYVRLRVWKAASGMELYSEWSTVKKVKIKK